MGGTWDSTNVIDSDVAVLTNVGLEHTRWLGPTIADIAREKLAVVRPGSTLVLGADVGADVAREAEGVASQCGARIVHAEADVDAAAALPAFQRRNFATAVAAAQAHLGAPLDPDLVRAAAAEAAVPGRFEVIPGEPVTVLDCAHNPDGIAALCGSLTEVLGNGPLVAVVSILEDKDAAAMLTALLPRCEAVVFTAAANPRALPPPTLASLAHQLNGPAATIEPDPHRALERARAIAGPRGVVLATGSIYLVADLKRAPGSRPGATL